MSDAMRESFEKWCKSENLPTTIWGWMYKDDRTFAAWKAWKSDRAVPIVLPPSIYVTDESDEGYMFMRDETKAALIAQGYTVAD